MTGRPIVDQSVRDLDLGALSHRKDGDDVMWSWSTTIDGETVVINVRGLVLRTIAARAVNNKNGRATQGGINARVMSRGRRRG